MKLSELDSYFRELLPIDLWREGDYGLNGLQVGRENQEVGRAAFAVDACMEVFRRSALWKADLLFVHHGLFWGKVVPVTGPLHDRLRFLLANDIGLYAVHLPLDLHPELGNNACLARMLGLEDVRPFGLFKGRAVGYKGRFPEPGKLDRIPALLGLDDLRDLTILPFGPEWIRTAGVISGSAHHEIDQAISEGLDLYVTGESSHEMYHTALEAGISVLCGGHYRTEVWGVQAMAKRVREDCGLETCFIDVPTGL